MHDALVVRLINLRELNICELTDVVINAGYQKFRAKQIWDWLGTGVHNFNQMTNLPCDLRKFLCEKFKLNSLEIEKVLTLKNEEVKKILFRLVDGNFIETALMKYKYGYSVCVSTQVGCKMHCRFCVSGMNGFVRNLTVSEILEQVILAQQIAEKRIGHVVLMGIGEPLDNFNNVVKFIELVSCPGSVGVGQRNISLSTVGLVDGIYALMKLKLKITLSVSLHAPNDELRCNLMPVNKRWNIQQLITACKEYFEVTHRRVSFEYIMLAGVNDSFEHAKSLKNLFAGFPVHINLIPANSGVGWFKASGRMVIERFKKRLEDGGFSVTVRRTLGIEIGAACGQMRCCSSRSNGLERG